MVEIAELAKQNPWWADASAIEGDDKIKDYDAAAVKWVPRLKKHLHLEKDVRYSLRGPRQVGKTTLAKLIIREELKNRKPANIFYFTCDLVTSPDALKDILESYLAWAQRQSEERKLIILDEVSRVKEWEFALKNIIDVLSPEGKTFILTGSSSRDLKHGIERLPGRKGELGGEQTHKILLPMKFAEYVETRNPGLYSKIRALGLADNSTRKSAFMDLIHGHSDKWADPLLPLQGALDALFEEYLVTGGIMTAVNQFQTKKEIGNTVYELYLQFFFGDVARMMREETTAKKILSAVVKHQGKPVGWTAIAKGMDIKSPLTVVQYADILHNLFALNVYNAFDQNNRVPKHRSDKKLQIPNPFFFHAFRGHVENPSGNYFRYAQQFIQTSEGKALLAEAVCGDHLTRLSYNFAPSDLFDQANSVFYVRTARGETIDFIARLGEELVPVEVKYQNQIGGGDYRAIRKFKHGIIATKKTFEAKGQHVAIPLPILLLFV
ncbi:ATP-binding protein [Candidatus Micrarchaeota archaeon]|nr:ATP-binding protein [Candidatus Micrarchaeota archaeon]